jgi:hypothetical protein
LRDDLQRRTGTGGGAGHGRVGAARGYRSLRGMGVYEVNVWRRLRILPVGVQEARLKVNDVLSESVILRLHRLEVVFHLGIFPNFLLELFYVYFFPLTECSLEQDWVSYVRD